MSIKNADKFQEALWDWKFLEGKVAKDKNIYPMDIDGCLEHRGNVLFIETMMHKDGHLHEGQRRTYVTLERQGNAVMFIRGLQTELCDVEIWHRGKTFQYRNMSQDRIARLIAKWWGWAERHPVRRHKYTPYWRLDRAAKRSWLEYRSKFAQGVIA